MPNSVKTLVLDGDGVTLNFSLGYINYLKEVHGFAPVKNEAPALFNFKDLYPDLEKPWAHIKDFTENFHHFSQVKALGDAPNVLRNMKLSGRFERIIMLTSCGDNPSTIQARTASLRREFGDVFDQTFFLPLGSRKHVVLDTIHAEFGRAVVVDDLMEHCVDALNYGHIPFLFNQKYNAHESHLELLSGKIGRISCLSELY